MLDAKVAIGALGKGRSASRLLNDELKAALPDIVGKDLYFGYLHGPSRLNPGDPPSRLRRLEVQYADLPAWARNLMNDDFGEFDALAKLPKQSRATAGWATIVVRCAALGVLRLSPKQLPFDATLGYPGEGPSIPRPDVDLRTYTALTPRVAARRAVRLREFLL